MDIWQHRYLELLQKAAAQAEQLARDHAALGLDVNFTLQYLRAENCPGIRKWGAICLSPNPPAPEWEFANCQPLRGDVPYSNYMQWLRERAGNLPICGSVDLFEKIEAN